MNRRWVALAVTGLALASPAYAAPQIVKGSDLAVRWPQLIGETIRVRTTPKQALDTIRYRVKIDTIDAVMLIAAEKVWTGPKLVCATVTGSERFSKQGRTQVVGLMLTDCPN